MKIKAMIHWFQNEQVVPKKIRYLDRIEHTKDANIVLDATAAAVSDIFTDEQLSEQDINYILTVLPNAIRIERGMQHLRSKQE